MGLSHYERNQKIVWAVHRITELSNEIDVKEYQNENYISLKNHCSNLWFELFGKSGNSGFWLLGSDDDVKSDGESIWSIALYSRIAYTQNNENDFEKSIYSQMLKMPQILENLSDRDGKVYQIYQWVQQIQYAVNRYTDDLSEQYVGMMNLCSNIYGLCFAIFNQQEYYAMAYMLNKISKILYGNCEIREKENWDIITVFLIKDCGHHSIRSPFKYLVPAYKLKEIKSIWKSLVQDDSFQNRLYSYLVLSTTHYNHQWKEIEILIAEHNFDKEKFNLLKLENQSQELKSKNDNLEEYGDEKKYYLNDLLGISNR